MLDLVVMDTVSGAVVPVGAPAVIASLQVEAHCVIGTGVPPRLAFINICREHKTDDIIHMLGAGNTVYAPLVEMEIFFKITSHKMFALVTWQGHVLSQNGFKSNNHIFVLLSKTYSLPP